MKKLLIVSALILFLSHGLFSQDYSIDRKQIKVSSKDKNYEINITYPQLNTRLKNSYFGFNSLVRKRMEAERDSFIVWMKDWEINEYNKDFSSSYEISDSIFYADNELISVQFYGYSYFAGAAHPNNWSFTINYDLENSKEIFLKDLLKSAWENKISEICISEIIKHKKDMGIEPDEWLNDGAGPKEENFKVFNITKKGLLVTFPTYQVGAYVEGPSEVYISYAEIKDIIIAESILSKFIK